MDNLTLFDTPSQPPQPQAWGDRQCRHCGNTYHRPGGGGTAYCRACIEADVYWRHTPHLQRRRTECAHCGTTYKAKASARWQLCPTCTQHPVFDRMKGNLANHRAPIEVVLAVMEWPYCANEECGQWLLKRVRRTKGRYGSRANYNIDHDHACCPGDVSCGLCIRGILCPPCNRSLLEDRSSAHLTGLIEYLRRHD